MTSALSLRAALKRGALVTSANWPVVFIDFTIESVFKFALAIPVIGGALMVAVLLGSDLRTLFAEGVLATADLVFGSLASAPIALGAFLTAIGVVAFGGGVIMAVIKGGTLAVLVDGERTAGDLHRPPLRMETFRRASAYTLPGILGGVRRFRRRAVVLACWLAAAYLVAAVLSVVGADRRLPPGQRLELVRRVAPDRAHRHQHGRHDHHRHQPDLRPHARRHDHRRLRPWRGVRAAADVRRPGRAPGPRASSA